MPAPDGWNERSGILYWYEANQHGDRYQGVVHFAQKDEHGQPKQPHISQAALEDHARLSDAMAHAHNFAIALIDSGTIKVRLGG